MSLFQRAPAALFADRPNLGLLIIAGMALGNTLTAQPLDVMLILDTSAGTEQSTDRIQPKFFGASDRVGAISAAPPSRLLLSLTGDKKRLGDTLQKAAWRIGGTVGRVAVTQNPTLDIAGAIAKACEQFSEAAEGPGKKVIIVVFAGEDRALPMAAPRLRASIDAVHAKLIAILVTRTPVDAGPSRLPRTIPGPIVPVLTAETLAELAQLSGGRIYRQAWDLKDVLKEARRP